MTTPRSEQDAQAELAAIVAGSTDAIISTNLEHTIVSWNKGAEEIFGYNQAEISGKQFKQLLPEDKRAEVYEFVEQVKRGERVQRLTTQAIRKDGTVIEVNLSFSPIFGADGRIRGVSKMVRDITEQKRATDGRQFLSEASTILASSLDYQTTLNHVAQLAVPKMADWCVVHIVQPDGKVERLALAHVDPAKIAWVNEVQKRFPDDPNAPTGYYKVIRTGHPELMSEIPEQLLVEAAGDNPENLEILHKFKFTSSLIVPLIARGKTLGAIQMVSAESGRRYDQIDLELAQELAGRAAIAIDNARLYWEAEQARSTAVHLADRAIRLQVLTSSLSTLLTSAEVAHTVVEQCITAFDAVYRCMVALLTQDSQWLEITYEQGYAVESMQRWTRMSTSELNLPIVYSVRQHRPLFLRSAEDWKQVAPDFPGGMTSPSLAIVPLLIEERALGALVLSFNEPQPFDPDEQTFIIAIAQQCAQAFERARLYQAEQQARAEVHEQQERLKVTLLSIGDAVIATDEKGRVTLMNTVAEQLTGWTQPDAFGRDLSEVFVIVNEQTRKAVENPVAKVVREGQIVGLANHTVLLSRNGDEIPIDDSGAPIRDANGDLIGVILVFRDIRERRLAEAHLAQLFESERHARQDAEYANQLKIRFLAMISHELRTPLASIKGFATTLLAPDVTWDVTSAQKFIAIIDEEADKLTDLIGQLLDLSQIQAGTLRIQPVPTSLHDIAENASAQLAALTRNHQLTMHIPVDLPQVVADPERIVHVLTNLVGNAAKYAPEGTSITVEATAQADVVQVDVCDEGPGIPPQYRESVFEAFRQLEWKELRRIKGAGLGLAICKGLIEAHKGRIWIVETSGDGTTVRFTLPIAAT